MNKKTLIIGAVIVVAAIIVGYGVSQKNTTNLDVASVEEQALPITAQVSPVRWIDPTPAASFDIFKSTDIETAKEHYKSKKDAAKYYKVGTFVAGDYKGGNIIRVTIPGDMAGDYIYRFVNQSEKITLLTKHSTKFYTELQEDDYLDPTKFSIDTTTVLSDLLFPEKITYGPSNFSLEGTQHFETFFNERYKTSDLTLAFVDAKLGNVYMDVPDRKDAEGGIKQNGFYLKAPDGTLRTYSLDINFYDKNHSLPKITWNDGTANIAEYVSTDRGGCGSMNYVSVVYGVTKNDLVAIGKTSDGDIVYALKDQQSSLLKKLYTGSGYNPDGATKISYEKFAQSKPLFFWFDAFGRAIKFQKSAFIPPSECGKPVIYLYPEKTTNVSVRIAPKGGFTKTEPEYGNGWNVTATPESELTDTSTGKTYPYLFWEGRGGIYTTPEKGFVVAQQNVHNFLVEKLTALGLNQKEQADFIEFWEPRMTGAPYFFVTFLGNRAMDAIAPLTIVPKPDSVIRILMDFLPLQKPTAVEGYDIKTPARNGFTVVEWGGVLR
ncbi:MAG: hypothetical protein Q7S16_05810 [bacterium]|nr:hypothetical protein [bacterium]